MNILSPPNMDRTVLVVIKELSSGKIVKQYNCTVRDFGRLIERRDISFDLGNMTITIKQGMFCVEIKMSKTQIISNNILTREELLQLQTGNEFFL